MNDKDKILEAFLERQQEEGFKLAASSDILELLALGAEPPQRYIAEFSCRGLVRTGKNEIKEWKHFRVGIHFDANYLRSVNPFTMLTWLGPPDPEHPSTYPWHPNVSARAPLVCVGRISPAMPLTDLLHQLYEIITYQRFTPNEFDALNRECCAWARANLDRFPLDIHPLKRRILNLEAE